MSCHLQTGDSEKPEVWFEDLRTGGPMVQIPVRV